MRRQDWPRQLYNTVEAAQGKKFEWQTHNCCTFTADCLLAMTGHDYMAEHRGKWTDARTAYVYIREVFGAGNVEAIGATLWGEPLENVLLAKRGDVAVVDDTVNGSALGVVVGADVAVVTPAGLGLFPLAEAKLAWRIA